MQVEKAIKNKNERPKQITNLSIIVLSSGYYHSTKMGTPTHFLVSPDLNQKEAL